MGRNGALGAGIGFVAAMALAVPVVLQLPFTALGDAAALVIGIVFGFTGLVTGMLVGRRF